MKYKKQIMSSLVTFLMFTSMNHANVDLQKELQKETSSQQLEDNYVLSSMLIKKSIKVGEITIESLESNLAFIKRLETDASFRKCIVIKDDLSKLDKLARGSNRLYEANKITEHEYSGYMVELKAEKEKLNKKLNSKECKEGK